MEINISIFQGYYDEDDDSDDGLLGRTWCTCLSPQEVVLKNQN